MVLSPNCAMIKFVASNQNSPGGNATKKCQESQDIMSPRILPRKIYKKKKKIARRPKSSKRSKLPRGPNRQDVKSPKAPSRDPNV